MDGYGLGVVHIVSDVEVRREEFVGGDQAF
jgi:hypothetical protein